MSRADVLQAQEEIIGHTVELNNRSEKDIKFAVQGLIIAAFFETSDFHNMQTELVNIVPDITLLNSMRSIFLTNEDSPTRTLFISRVFENPDFLI